GGKKDCTAACRPAALGRGRKKIAQRCRQRERQRQRTCRCGGSFGGQMLFEHGRNDQAAAYAGGRGASTARDGFEGHGDERRRVRSRYFPGWTFRCPKQ